MNPQYITSVAVKRDRIRLLNHLRRKGISGGKIFDKGLDYFKEQYSVKGENYGK